MNLIQEEMKYLATEAFEPVQRVWIPLATQAMAKCVSENDKEGFLSVAEARALQQAYRYFNVRAQKKGLSTDEE